MPKMVRIPRASTIAYIEERLVHLRCALDDRSDDSDAEKMTGDQ